MLIKFKNVPGRGVHNPVRWGDGDDIHYAVCSTYALKLYQQTFIEDPSSKHHSLINDVMDTGDGTEFLSLVGIDWDADMRATWAMMRSADVAGLNDGVDPTPSYDELLAATDALEAEGLSGFVYTELTDVEEETNGILTYDRRVNKLEL